MHYKRCTKCISVSVNLNTIDNRKGSRSSVAYFFKQSSKALYPFLFGTCNESNMTAWPS